VPYGDRFIKFITAVTKTREEAEREDNEQDAIAQQAGVTSTELDRGRPDTLHHTNTDNSVIRKAESQALKSERRGSNEDGVPDRTLGTVRSASADRTNDRGGMTLPIVDEVGESSSTGGRSAASNHEADDRPPTPPKDKNLPSTPPKNKDRPPTPPKDNGLTPSPQKAVSTRSSSFDGKALPALPVTTEPEVMNEKQSIL
jgi:1-phosphatidylinositol-4-phosphate 5-kinase